VGYTDVLQLTISRYGLTDLDLPEAIREINSGRQPYEPNLIGRQQSSLKFLGFVNIRTLAEITA